ncbi:TetR/AcrR family transcriptional regulator [Paenibacillus sp. S150]|uniref:TetR/AcrR family transcriptional regulator n=1 Tax=Paenibacillus sp. S150 TaxID=2749826 RepID=UPI001C58BAB9
MIEEAGVPIMTLYNHFASKEELIVEMLKRRESRYFARLRFRHQDHQGGLASACLQMAEAHIEWLKEHEARGCLFLRAKEEFGGDPAHPILQLVNGHKRSMLQFFGQRGMKEAQAMRLALLVEGATAKETEEADKVGRSQRLLEKMSFTGNRNNATI